LIISLKLPDEREIFDLPDLVAMLLVPLEEEHLSSMLTFYWEETAVTNGRCPGAAAASHGGAG